MPGAGAKRLLFVALAAGAVLALGGAGCSKSESCRPNTLFLSVSLGPYASADRLDVDVTVGGVDGAAGTSQHTQLHLPGGANGGVEIEFPAGYPAGHVAMVTLTLYAGNAPLATQLVSQLLASTCTAARVDFGGTSDAGSEGGSGGAGGAPGGAAGAGGQGGAAGGTGAGGRAGSVGTGGAGAGGAAGGAGAGGAAAGGKGGGVGGAGGSSVCVPTGAENCFNGLDDDCDGHIDCDDSDCGPSVAECVAMDPTSAPIGMLSGVGAGACATTGYLNETALMANLTVPDCAGDPAAGGCSCKPGAVSCSTNLTGFMTAAECAATTSTGESAGSFKTGQDNNCLAIPSWKTSTSGDIFGIATTPFTATAAGCTASGSPSTKAPTWGTNATFCSTKTIGAGCGSGKVCVPAAPANSLCQLYDGAHTCAAGSSQSPWNTGYSGSQTCGPCTCGSQTGANCDNVVLTNGSDYTCSGYGTATAAGGRLCFPGGGIYEPGVQFSGTPTAGSCQPMSAATGSITMTGLKTLCCP